MRRRCLPGDSCVIAGILCGFAPWREMLRSIQRDGEQAKCSRKDAKPQRNRQATRTNVRDQQGEFIMPVKTIPEGYHSVTPHLIVRGAAEAIDFYRKAFG